ncbi:hypothetical protein Neosp_008253 [[Neocosmospora] mangrovei]
MASTRSSTNKHEPTSSDLDKNQKRKLRNRLSQRAFRRRQAEYLRDLRNRAEASQKPENERVAELEEENGRLRAHITELQSRLEGVQVTLQMIASSSSKILGRSKSSLPCQPPSEERDSEHGENEPSRDNFITADKAQSEASAWPPFSSTALEAIQIPNLSFPTDVDSTIAVPTSYAFQARSSSIRDPMDSVGPVDPNLSKSPLQLQRIPDIWNFNCQMGSQSYVDAIESYHPYTPYRLYQFDFAVLAMFNSVARPGVMNRYTKTRFLHTIERNLALFPQVYIYEADFIASITLQQGKGIDNMASLPAPDIKTLFSSPECAYLDMNCGAFYYKISPVFFSKYPELWDPSDEIVASGVPLKLRTQTTLANPNYVGAMAVATCWYV